MRRSSTYVWIILVTLPLFFIFPENFILYDFVVDTIIQIQTQSSITDGKSFVNCMDSDSPPRLAQGGAGGDGLPQNKLGWEQIRLPLYNPEIDTRNSRSDGEVEGFLTTQTAANSNSLALPATNVDLFDPAKGTQASPQSPAEKLSPGKGTAPHVALPAPAASQNGGFETPPPSGGFLPVSPHVALRDTPFPDDLAGQFASMSMIESNAAGGK